jgi:hypothetical protein
MTVQSPSENPYGGCEWQCEMTLPSPHPGDASHLLGPSVRKAYADATAAARLQSLEVLTRGPRCQSPSPPTPPTSCFYLKNCYESVY